MAKALLYSKLNRWHLFTTAPQDKVYRSFIKARKYVHGLVEGSMYFMFELKNENLVYEKSQ
jgi:hypothetical protein